MNVTTYTANPIAYHTPTKGGLKNSQKPLSKQLTQLLFKRTNVAVKMRCGLFAAHLGSLLLALLVAFLVAVGIYYGVAHVSEFNFEASDGTTFNFEQRRNEIAGVITFLAASVLFVLTQMMPKK
jgi:hypothetical protein